jgi:surface carbohydrate biosynthesis protein
MKKSNIFIPIEIKSRELDHSILLAIACLKENFRVYIGSKISINKIINWKKDKNGIILYKSGLYLEDILKYKKKLNFFCILDQEVGVSISYQNMDLALKSRVLKGTENYIDKYFVANNFLKRKFHKFYPKLKKKIIFTGSPHYELWNKKFQYIYENEKKIIKKKNKDYVLFCSNLTFLNIEKIKSSDEYMRTDGWPHSKKFLDNRLKRMNLRYEEFKKFRELLSFLDKKIKYHLIIRPHPSDPIKVWEKTVKNFKNISCAYSGEVNKHILAAKKHIHVGCSTSIFAQMNKIPTRYILLDKKFARKHFIQKNSKILTNKEQILKFINKDSKNTSGKNILQFENENKDSCFRICKEFKKLNCEASEKIQLSAKYLINDKISLNYWKLKKNILKIKNKNKLVSQQNQKIPGGIPKEEIQKFIKNFKHIKNTKIREIIPDCIEIDV